MRRLPFSAAQHIAAAPHVAAALTDAARRTATQRYTVGSVYKRLNKALYDVDRILRAPAPPGLRQNSGTAARSTRDDGASATRARAPAHGTLRAQLKRARTTLKAAKRAPRRRQEAVRDAVLGLRDIERQLRSARRTLLAQRLRQHIRRLETLRISDPSAFFDEVQNTVMADGFSYPNHKSVATLAQLYTHYKDKFAENRSPPPACPPNHGSPGSYDAHIPRETHAGAGAAIIARRVDWTEVYLLLFPPTRRLLPHLRPCCDNCALCADYSTRLQHWRPNNPDSHAPQHKPSLSTCRSAGKDGLIAELLRFTRPAHGTNGDRLAVFHHRRSVATALAALLDSWLRHGVPRTAHFRDVLISAPAKPLKPGAAPSTNPAADTRPISVETLLAKVFELLLNARAEHWRVHEHLVSAPQVAFSAFHSPEMHVLALREMISMRRRAGDDTYVLFVDFKAAYDSVHHSMLWHVVRRMGFPEDVIRVLSDWYRSRTGSIKAGGSRSPPFRIDKGMPQGGPLSTLLWNLFIEPLSRRLALIPGVTVTRRDALNAALTHTVKLTHLLFADDLAILASSPEALREALRVTAEWAAAFGCTINDGVGKTEAMCFPADAAEGEARRASLPPLEVAVPGHVPLRINWVAEYRYLGALLDMELSVERTLTARLNMLDAVIASTFTYNRVLSNLGCHTQTQLFNTLAMGAVNYLMAALPVPPALAAKVDSRITKIARQIFGAPRAAPRSLLRLEMPGMPFHATCAMHQARLLFSLQHMPVPNSIAAEIVRFQLATYRMPPARSRGYVPFARRVQAAIAALRGDAGRRVLQRATRELPLLQPTSRLDVHRSASVFRRAYAYRGAIAALPCADTTSARLVAAHRTSPAARPPAANAEAHLRVLYHAGSHLPPLALGTCAALSPMSAAGPGCGGALLAVTTLTWTTTRTPLRCRLGRLAFAYWPWSQHDRTADDCSSDDDDSSDSGSDAAAAPAQHHRSSQRRNGLRNAVDRIIRYSAPGRCPHCDEAGRRNTDDGPWHFTQECPHPDAIALRRRMLASLRHMLAQLLQRIHRAQERAGTADPEDMQARASDELRALTTPALMDWKSPDVRHVAFHMLTAVPWSATSAPGNTWPLSSWLGSLFDKTRLQRRFRRNIANHVIRWADCWLRAFARLRGRLLHDEQ
jgi:hypothetical protein